MPQHDATSRGQQCVTCHDGQPHAGLPGDLPRFDFGGRVFVQGTTQPAKGKLVVLEPENGERVAMITNDEGYFWWPPVCDSTTTGTDGYGSFCNGPGAKIPVTFPATVIVSDDTSMTDPERQTPFIMTPPTNRPMCAKIMNGNCASCHDGQQTAIVF